MKTHGLTALDEISRESSVDCVTWLLVDKLIRFIMNNSKLRKEKYKMFSLRPSRVPEKKFKEKLNPKKKKESEDFRGRLYPAKLPTVKRKFKARRGGACL